MNENTPTGQDVQALLAQQSQEIANLKLRLITLERLLREVNQTPKLELVKND